MATTGELRAIIEELQLVDIGDAASYLGEEEMSAGDSLTLVEAVALIVPMSINGSDGIGKMDSSVQ